MWDIDLDRLVEQIQLAARGGTHRDIAKTMQGVSASTIYRILKGGWPDLETFLLICGWLGDNPSTYIYWNNNRGEYAPDDNTKVQLGLEV